MARGRGGGDADPVGGSGPAPRDAAAAGPAREEPDGDRARAHRRVHPGAAVAWTLFGALLIAGWVFAPDRAAVRGMLLELGPLAPAAFLVLEFVQVVIAPIPGQPIEVPGGWALGMVPGVVIASIGAFAGSMVAFGFARRYGRPWVERRLTDRGRRRVERYLDRGRRAEWMVFWLMLVPSFPRDPLCYLAGLTRLSTTRFALIAALGRPVGLVPWVALGSDGIAVAIEVQLLLAAAAGALWLGWRVLARVLRWRADTRASDETVASTNVKGERYA